jgi:hypothetical protein
MSTACGCRRRPGLRLPSGDRLKRITGLGRARSGRWRGTGSGSRRPARPARPSAPAGRGGSRAVSGSMSNISCQSGLATKSAGTCAASPMKVKLSAPSPTDRIVCPGEWPKAGRGVDRMPRPACPARRRSAGRRDSPRARGAPRGTRPARPRGRRSSRLAHPVLELGLGDPELRLRDKPACRRCGAVRLMWSGCRWLITTASIAPGSMPAAAMLSSSRPVPSGRCRQSPRRKGRAAHRR